MNICLQGKEALMDKSLCDRRKRNTPHGETEASEPWRPRRDAEEAGRHENGVIVAVTWEEGTAMSRDVEMGIPCSSGRLRSEEWESWMSEGARRVPIHLNRIVSKTLIIECPHLNGINCNMLHNTWQTSCQVYRCSRMWSRWTRWVRAELRGGRMPPPPPP